LPPVGSALPALGNQTLTLSFDGTVGTGAFTRASSAWNPETGALVGTNVPRYVTGKSGQAILIEESSTNYFLNSQGVAAVTQNISVTTANSGKWTCTVYGAGTVTSSAGTATASGYGAATVGAPNTITVTGNGTVTYTVSGATAATVVNVENLPYGTSMIVTGGSTVTRAGDTLLFDPTGIINPAQGTIAIWVDFSAHPTMPGNNVLFGTAAGGSSNRINIQQEGAVLKGYTYTSGGISSSSNATAPTSGWHLVGITWNSAGPYIWIDAIKSPSNTGTNIPTGVGTTAYVGAGTVGTGQWTGALDAFRIYNRPLTATEMMQLYRAGR
jgi:hypothetical protein